MKKVIVITSSPRKGGNSETLADCFIKGAESAGHSVKKIAVRDLGLQFCTGCMYCQSHDNCVLGDGMNAVYSEIENSDVIAFATPVYYYAVCGQLKTFLDRLNPLYPRKNRFKEVYLLASAAENDDGAFDGAASDINGWTACFDGVKFIKILRGKGLEGREDVSATPFPEEAFNMGKNI